MVTHAREHFAAAHFPIFMNEMRIFDQRLARDRELFAEKSKNISGSDLIKAKLAHMVAIDQFSLRYEDDVAERHHLSRKQTLLFREMMRSRIDAIARQNTALTKEILGNLPQRWPLRSEFGDDNGCPASDHAFLIVQHSDHDPTFQQDILTVLRDYEYTLQGKPEYRPDNLAYLHDRVQVNSGLKQRYGTQGRLQNDIWIPFQCESDSIDEINSLRATLKVDGNSTLQEYYEHMNRHIERGKLPELRFILLDPKPDTSASPQP